MARGGTSGSSKPVPSRGRPFTGGGRSSGGQRYSRERKKSVLELGEAGGERGHDGKTAEEGQLPPIAQELIVRVLPKVWGDRTVEGVPRLPAFPVETA